MKAQKPEQGLTWLALFASSGTLVCCALPITLVTLGMGATVASLTSSLPILITLSQHKIWVFAFSAIMLLFSGWLLYRPGRSCPTDPALAAQCQRMHRWNLRVWWVSVAIWLTGFTAAFLALPLMRWLDGA